MKRLIVNRLAIGNLKTRKKQYFTMTLGILLAVIFSCTSFFLISFIKTSKNEMSKRNIGNFYGYFFHPDKFFDIEEAQRDGIIGEYGYAHITGFIYSGENRLLGTPVAWLDENAKKLYNAVLLDGKYPDSVGEIALESTTASRLGITAVAGQEITLNFLQSDTDRFADVPQEKSYTLVGILNDKQINIEYATDNYYDLTKLIPSAFICKEDAENFVTDIPAAYYNPTAESIKTHKVTDEFGDKYFTCDYFEYMKEEIIDDLEIAGDYSFIYKSEYSPAYIDSLHEGYKRELSIFSDTKIGIALLFTLLAISTVGIFNAFSINLLERRKQIGMLRALGATKRQIISIYSCETLLLSLFCLPIGITVSALAVFVLAKLSGDGFVFAPSIIDFTVCILVSLVCIMLSTLFALIKAVKITPLQAIKSTSIPLHRNFKKIRHRKSFNASTLLAKRNKTVYKPRHILISILLFDTVLFSCYCSTYTDSFTDLYRDPNIYTTYSIDSNGSPLNRDAVEELSAFPYLGYVYGQTECTANIDFDNYTRYMKLLLLKDLIDNDRLSELRSIDYDSSASFDELCKYLKEYVMSDNDDGRLFKCNVKAYDVELCKLIMSDVEVIDGEINLDKINSGEEIVIAAEPELFLLNPYGENFLLGVLSEIPYDPSDCKIIASSKFDIKVGDKINLRTIFGEDSVDKTVTVGAVVEPLLNFDFHEFTNEFALLTTTEGLFFLTERSQPYNKLVMRTADENNDGLDASVYTFLNRFVSEYGHHINSNYRENKSVIEIEGNIMIACFITIILQLTLCISMVNNSLNRRIRESRREIGTLRAVGASTRDLTLTFVKQFLSTVIFGIGSALAVYIAFYLYYTLKVDSNLKFELLTVLITILPIFLICGLNLYINIKKMTKYSVVENIREL